jgi:hypothetical protein
LYFDVSKIEMLLFYIYIYQRCFVSMMALWSRVSKLDALLNVPRSRVQDASQHRERLSDNIVDEEKRESRLEQS